MRRLATLTFLIASFFSLGFRWLQTEVGFINLGHEIVFGKKLGLNADLTAWKQVWPYFLLAFLVIVPLGLSFLPILRKRQETRGINDER